MTGDIRSFEGADYEPVAAVWAAAGAGVLSRDELTRKLTRDPDLFLVATDGPELTGAVLGTWDGRRGWIFRLAVHPDHRRRGIATALVRELESRFRALDCPRINLLVLPDNEAGLRFWQDLGYLPAPDVLCTKPL
ncbi:Acetyltransferase [Actinoplanes sp. SE50]|uniref:GNAT family N-acetyltransferase n=1 Tax=unclassified Actinoplanes TaxID=2626549 RepID=UPI00023EBF01|nr:MULTISPECIES: GNAT family N-acetyltransferase [unclassified Actinoplanes]AEV84036.1 Acetyltransferase [Actinoplanes sp. SE50/110]ATO82429.1 Acetyltransferase [Actinoplanes sp. SE50]SLL99836.1 acetyltransferase [Actinoplanes sp. SE50/110]